MATFTIVIPYYQKEAGILQRALASVFAQSFADYDILVVDDASPYPAEKEVAALAPGQREKITVLKQANTGPGGARNTGLENVPPSTRFVAFLDSDDIWLPKHLETAYQAMTDFEANCYFASIGGGDEFYYHFGMADLEKTETPVRLSETPLLLELPNLASVMLKNWSFLHLSCMIIGRDLFEKIRFDEKLRLAAEDVLFFCDNILAAKRTVLSDGTGAMRGEGVNIFHGVDNGSPQFLRQQMNTLVALERLETRFSDSPEDVAKIEHYKNQARKQALWGQAARLKRRKLPQLSLMLRWLWRDPRLLRSAMQLGGNKLANRHHGSP